MYRRVQFQVLSTRLSEPPKRIIVVSGPRQIGKTTLVKQALEALAPGMESIYLAADDSSTEVADSLTAAPAQSYLLPGAPRDAEWLVNTWRRASMLADQSRVGAVLVLDEIQKIPRWSDIVKGLWDADRAVGRKLHAVVLGSSPLLMQQGLTESLAGRYETIRMSHWSFLEMFQAFDLELDKFIYFGGYPGAVHDIGDEARWRDYIRDSLIAPNIDKDILMMTRVDKPALLKLLFNLGCELSGQTWSYNKMLGQLKDAGNTTTLAHYLGLLGDAGLLVGFQKYAGRAHRKRGSSPKLNVLNTALMSVASGYSFEQAKADRTFWGRLVESAIGAHLQNTASSDTRVSYWRASPYEVDFVLERGRRCIGIEVKSNAGAGKTSGMSRFENEFKPERCLLVGGSDLPLERFLVEDADAWFE